MLVVVVSSEVFSGYFPGLGWVEEVPHLALTSRWVGRGGGLGVC
jgi:hypothetical protein